MEPNKLPVLNEFALTWCCTEYMLIAAGAEDMCGVAGILFGTELKHAKAVLNTPKDHEISCHIALGYPDRNLRRVRHQTISIGEKMRLNK